MIIICENSYYLCKEYLHFYTKQNKNNMKTPQKRIFLLACLGLTVHLLEKLTFLLLREDLVLVT